MTSLTPGFQKLPDAARVGGSAYNPSARGWWISDSASGVPRGRRECGRLDARSRLVISPLGRPRRGRNRCGPSSASAAVAVPDVRRVGTRSSAFSITTLRGDSRREASERALGQRFYDIWSEIWPDISPLIDAAMAGQATYREDLPLVMNRKGYDEQTWFTFSYSPVRDESGKVAGMFCAVSETTQKVLAEHALRGN